MILDSHTHIFPPRIIANREKCLGEDSTLREMYSDPSSNMTNGDDLINAMNHSGIDKAIVMGPGWTNISLAKESNDYILDAVQRFPDRLIGFCSINPIWGESAIIEIERCVSSGIKGIGELHPSTQGFDITNKFFMHNVMDTALKLNIPVLVHGSEPVGHKYPGKGDTTPEKLYSFISNFPQNSIICAHWGGGLPFYALMPEVTNVFKNTYFDTAASPFLYKPSIYRVIGDLIGFGNVLFGTDFPLMPYKEYFDELKLVKITPGDKEKILGGNARTLLGS